ncbi:ATP synthase F1 subunit gamma [Tuwongella immobilis]|uniref:ATP synthase gamma chain n=1 Tax=Tuwongella immobilis TaxID=692036 RepID=A0A6C2YQN3_9BACT|nr:ATP synthase F1 subunit gamma [Tuwongella immobilis]VIP03469.1 atp synthase gamma subunit : ATP synthase gamma chain OS=Planctomyces maris DSM 8797 GN=atpG PE=3 SV=1: ATP-synt [Tuwongella immobilis]VTS04310.1 atp synthase gamma subunit : ATP synthase gamma chain OS=Planctomyces maris DSM 8797 GN=atpG PE=3 SV=1: ATP-synt [Tuwongella immobilis]
MAKTRVLVKRRKAIRNIRRITRTMELIATARFKKALDRASEAEAYTRKIAELAADLSRSAGDVRHPLLETHATTKKAVLLVLTSNRGLCGGYNAGIIREAMADIRKLETDNIAIDLEVSGKRGLSYFRYQGRPIVQGYTHFEDKPTYAEVEVLANRYIEAYVTGQIDRVDVAYTKFQSAARQVAVVETLLPLSSVTTETAATASSGPSVTYDYQPSAADILNELVPVALKVRLFKFFLDAAVSEQIARRVAMKSATEAAGDLLKAITQEYNRARQAQITKELAEIIAGAEALK